MDPNITGIDPGQSRKKPRSKHGCKLKKVKCDEQQPRCVRCTRLRLTCSWVVDTRPMREKRRGAGSLKSRGLWKPTPISPKDTLPSYTINTTEPITTRRPSVVDDPGPPSTQGEDWNLEVLDVEPQSNLVDASLSWSTISDIEFINETDEEEIASLLDSFAEQRRHEEMYFNAFLEPTAPLLSCTHIPLPNSMILTSSEHQALHHYSTAFSLSYTKKHPQWSTLSMLLRIGSQKAMVMHLLLAVSLNDLSWRQHNEDLRSAAQQNYRAGANLLVNIMTSTSEPDHVGVLAAFWFLYLYKTKWMHVDVECMNHLSRTVTSHIEKYSLDKLCYNSSTSNSTELVTGQTAGPHDWSVVALMMTCLYYQDIKYGFYYCGGKLAEYLNTDKQKLGKIYDLGRSALALNWGSDYPINEVLDDNENYTMLKLNNELNIILEDINKVFRLTQRSSQQENFERELDNLEQRYISVFRLAAVTTAPRTRTLVNADLSIVYYHAVRIYLFRCILVDPNKLRPPKIQEALSSILTITHRALQSSEDALFHRIEWPLFIAGVETDDVIHREWILCKLDSRNIKAALERVIQAQKNSGSRVGVEVMREAFCNGLWSPL